MYAIESILAEIDDLNSSSLGVDLLKLLIAIQAKRACDKNNNRPNRIWLHLALAT
ncbi:MAG: hypothetical protein IPJ39_17390 [Saprospiraceae bacterium]|nr:hypothetical protein [Saprospiraceae bacterium]